MTQKTGKMPLGSGRVVFIAMMDTIKNELDQGHSVRAIYDRYQDKFAPVMGYWQFCKYVRQLRERVGAGPIIGASIRKPRSDRAAAAPSSTPPAVQSGPEKNASPPRHSEGMNHARNRPEQPTFHHHGIVQEGEVERLLGPGYLPKRR